MANSRFTSTHSKILINLDYVLYASGGDCAGSELRVIMHNDIVVTLEGTDADNFRAQWRDYSELR